MCSSDLFLFSMPRFSEDLDFALERPRPSYDFQGYLEAIRRRLKHEGYAIELKISDKKTVQAAFVRFPGLPFELGLSPRETQVLSVKIEVDTRPPEGAGLATTLVRRHVTLQIQHHDRASLLAGKLHAILMRAHTKGRDLYDLLWYLSDRTWPEPNLVLLNHALVQTGWDQGPLDAGAWRGVVRDQLNRVDFRRARMDLAPFIESEHDLGLVTRENLIGLLEGR